MKTMLRFGAVALAVGTSLWAVAANAADDASTTGGITVKSSDGNFEASLGGRIHFDGAILFPDDNSRLGITNSKNDSGFFFRRVFISLKGKAYGWGYQMNEDISTNGSAASGFNELWLEHSLLPGGTIYIGQHKPWRSMDEMSSNNNLPLMERNVLSANGLFGGRDFTQGLYYRNVTKGLLGSGDSFWWGLSFYTDGKAGQTTGRSYGSNARLAYAPIVGAHEWLHFGLTYSYDNVSREGDGYGKIAPGYSTWYAKKGQGVTLVSFASGSGNSGVNAGVGTAEIAGAYGAFYFQGEYGTTHQWSSLKGSAGKTATVSAFSTTLAYMLTGETRPYSTSDASYGGIKPLHSYGAFEVAVRYDFERNRTLSTCAIPIPAGGPAATNCSVHSLTAGINYYVNPNVRFMINYSHGRINAGVPGGDHANAIMARAQFAF